MHTIEQLREHQLALEEEAVGIGRRRYFETVDRQGRENSRPGHQFTAWFLPEVTEHIRGWLEQGAMGARRRGTAYMLHQAGANPEELALLTLRSCMRAVTEAVPLSASARRLGAMVEEHLAWQRGLASADRPYLEKMTKVLTKKSSEDWSRRVARYCLRRVQAELGWSERTQMLVGGGLIECLCETGTFRRVTNGTGVRSRGMIEASPDVVEWFAKLDNKLADSYPLRSPMVVEPAPWEDFMGGGYLTRPMPLVTRATPEQRETLTGKDMPLVYQALNRLQAVRWQVNSQVLEVLLELQRRGDQGVLPPAEDYEVPAKPDDIATNEEARRQWRREAAMVHQDNVRLVGQRLSVLLTAREAERFAEFEAIHFVHRLDWRGRIYPVSTYLSPQGDDLSRGLLRFADGERMTKDGAFWLAVHLANCYGFDKAPLRDRVQWVEEHTQEILDSAINPIEGQRWWMKGDKPWSTLAACFEYAGWLQHGEDHVTRLVCYVDGSCNGLQHLSAAAYDHVGGQATNLVPANEPSDIYQLVADRVVEKLRARDTDSTALFWLDYGVTRSLVKRNVMTLPYGVTQFGMRDQLMEVIRKAQGGTVSSEWFPFAAYLVDVIRESISEVVVSAVEVMAWMQSVAEVACKHEVDLRWMSPSGMPIVQCYRETRGDRVEVYIGGKRRQLSLLVATSKLNKRRQKMAVAPNVIHSWDASHLVLTVNAWKARPLATIHDAYGTLPTRMDDLSHVLRAAFRVQYSVDRLQEWRDQILAALPEGTELPELPTKGTLDIAAVEDSTYFFA